MKEWDLHFDTAFTSELSRAQNTLFNALNESQPGTNVTVRKTWQLNERHYGRLTGLSKRLIKFERTFDGRPEPMHSSHPYWNSIASHPAYRDLIATGKLPRAESLRDTSNRVIPYWNGTIVPEMLAGRRIIIAAHHNVLRIIFKHLSGLNDEETVSMDLPNAAPILHEFDEDLNVLVSKSFIF